MINRRKRQRLSAPDTLEGAWDRGDPPPDWAYAPGEHHETLVELQFFGTDARPIRRDDPHPYLREWRQAMEASKQ